MPLWQLLNGTGVYRFAEPAPYYGEALEALGVDAYDMQKYETISQRVVDLDELIYCSRYGFVHEPYPTSDGGSAEISGRLDQGQGTLRVSLDNCSFGARRATGEVFAEVRPFADWENGVLWDISADGIHYFDGVVVADEDRTYTAFGFYEYTQGREDQALSAMVYQAPAAGVNVVRYLENTDNGVERATQTGTLAIDGVGSVDMTRYENTRPSDETGVALYPVRTFSFVGDSDSQLDISETNWGYLLVTLDTDADGDPDLGRYFRWRDSLQMYADISLPFFSSLYDSDLLPFVPMLSLNAPPVLTGYVSLDMPFAAGDPVAVSLSAGDYFDPDTPLAALIIETRWRVNGQPIAAADDLLALDAEYFSRGDYVSVVVTISDGDTTITAANLEESVW